MLIDRKVPAVLLLNTTCATTPTPNTIRMNVPKNSASISRSTPRGIGLLQDNHRDTETRRNTERKGRKARKQGKATARPDRTACPDLVAAATRASRSQRQP